MFLSFSIQITKNFKHNQKYSGIKLKKTTEILPQLIFPLAYDLQSDVSHNSLAPCNSKVSDTSLKSELSLA